MYSDGPFEFKGGMLNIFLEGMAEQSFLKVNTTFQIFYIFA